MTDFQYRQVLDNLAMFDAFSESSESKPAEFPVYSSDSAPAPTISRILGATTRPSLTAATNPALPPLTAEDDIRIKLQGIQTGWQVRGPLPWHLNLDKGQVQVSDSVNPSYGYSWPPYKNAPALSGTHNLTEYWSTTPVTSGGRLQSLQNIYYYEVHDNRHSATPWFHHGDVPDFRAPFIGHYHGHYVWVDATEINRLSMFTMIVLAVANPPAETPKPSFGPSGVTVSPATGG